MIEALYTETLQDYLDNRGGDFPTSIKNLLNQIPNFVFKDTDLNIDIDYSFIDLFREKYDIREICAESEELFEHFLMETGKRCVIEYVPKIYMWLNNFKDLFKFTVRLELGSNSTDTTNSSGENTYYLNPITKERDLKLQDVDKNENNVTSQNYTQGHKDVLQSVWGKTRATLLEQILDLKNIYSDCLEYFESCFMGIY